MVVPGTKARSETPFLASPELMATLERPENLDSQACVALKGNPDPHSCR